MKKCFFCACNNYTNTLFNKTLFIIALRTEVQKNMFVIVVLTHKIVLFGF